MNHEEKTSSASNIVHINFVQEKRARKARRNGKGVSSVLGLIQDLDLRRPWVLRLLAVVVILILSMLVL